MRLLLRKGHGSFLAPVDELSQTELGKIGAGEVVSVTLKKARNPKLNSLYWSLLHKVFDNQERYQTVDELHDALKLAAGASKVLHLVDGTEVLIPDSTSFDAMDELKFREFFKRACDVIAWKFLPEIKGKDVEDIALMLGTRFAT
jgi:phosphoglycerate dehydrogenase-like enzyme